MLSLLAQTCLQVTTLHTGDRGTPKHLRTFDRALTAIVGTSRYALVHSVAGTLTRCMHKPNCMSIGVLHTGDKCTPQHHFMTHPGLTIALSMLQYAKIDRPAATTCAACLRRYCSQVKVLYPDDRAYQSITEWRTLIADSFTSRRSVPVIAHSPQKVYTLVVDACLARKSQSHDRSTQKQTGLPHYP
jgi:hypothetical protein